MRRNGSNRIKRNASGPVRAGYDSDENEHTYFEVGCPQSYIPLHERINKKIADKTPFFSLEFFPPRTANGVANFYTRLDRYREGGPLFVDITWHAAGDPANMDRDTSSCSIASGVLNYCRLDTMLHLTCAQYTKETTIAHLKQARAIGIRNILALRGDLPKDSDFREYEYHASDLIRWIRQEFGDWFTVCCAGYPTGHPEAPSYEEDLQFLKKKVDAGAHFIITQLFFECETYEKFVDDCRAIGITVPIIPGIMPIMGYAMAKKMAMISQLEIPERILNDLEPIKHDDDLVQQYGKKEALKMCKRLLGNGYAPAVHMYTMNREGPIREILKELGLWQKRPATRPLPWDPHGINHPLRCREDVRPIYWSFRPRSYICRTQDWELYPNGRWGHSSSPCFADLNSHYLFNLIGIHDKDKLRSMFGYVQDFDDVCEVFRQFITGELNRNGIQVTALPWSEDFEGTANETGLITDQILWCIRNGILTTNSQPNVNCAPSLDRNVGWGNAMGYIFQRAYLEFFCTKEMSETLIDIITEDYEPRINYHCINASSSYERTNGEPTTPIAVTWGVFPGKEIAQPTVVDPLAFHTWKQEAFHLWLHNWRDIYKEGTRSREVIQDIHDNYILFTMVDNDFPTPTIIFRLIKMALEQMGIVVVD